MYKAKLEQRAIEWQIKYQAPYSQDNYNNYNDILNGN
jgi:hypothetical protein